MFWSRSFHAASNKSPDWSRLPRVCLVERTSPSTRKNPSWRPKGNTKGRFQGLDIFWPNVVNRFLNIRGREGGPNLRLTLVFPVSLSLSRYSCCYLTARETVSHGLYIVHKVKYIPDGREINIHPRSVGQMTRKMNVGGEQRFRMHTRTRDSLCLSL